MAKKRRKNKWNIRRFLRNIVLVFIVVFIVYSIFVIVTKPKSDIFQVTFENIALNSTHKAIVLRDEIIVKSVNYGVFEPFVGDGERIKKNQIVGKLTIDAKGDNDEHTSEKQAKISIVDKDKLTDEVNQLYRALVEKLKDKSYIEAKTLKYSLDLKLKRLTKLVESDESSAYALKEAMVRSAGNSAANVGETLNVPSTDAGIISFYFDNYEELLTFENRYRLDYSTLFSETISAKNVVMSQVKPDDAIFKIVSNIVWYLACEVNPEDFERFMVGAPVTVSMQSQSLTAKIFDTFEADGKGVMILEMAQQASGMHNTRMADIALKRDEVQGLKLPKTAIVNKKGRPGVYVVDLDKQLHYVAIETLADVGEYVVVQEGAFSYKDEAGKVQTVYTISHGDRIIDNAIKYKEGDTVD